VELAAHLLRKYQFTTTDLYRHYDITGKDCPKMMLEDAPWQAFKQAVERAMSDDPRPPFARGRVTAPDLNVRTGAGTQFTAVERLKFGTLVYPLEESNGWYRIDTNRWVSKNFVEINYNTWLGRVNSRTGANIRSGPGANFPVMDALANGGMTDVSDESGEWLRIGADRWVHKNLIQQVDVRQGRVSGTEDLNVRVGPGTDFRIARRIGNEQSVRILNEQDGWYQLGVSEWAFGKFIKIG
jgi:uncharacterized protein YgiM (DUF1202 family)